MKDVKAVFNLKELKKKVFKNQNKSLVNIWF